MKKSHALALLLTSCLAHTHLFSLPVVKQIKHGKVQVAESMPGKMQITASDKAVIHFDNFDIQTNEAVQFIQPGKSAKALGRILNQAPSEIHGSLLSNGQIFLVNPQGFVFGKTAQVNVGALIASALDIADQDFVKDKYHFVLDSSDSTAKIINHGSLISHSGPIALLAPEVSNQGVIRAIADKVVLASAERVVLDFDGDKLLRFEVSGELAQGAIEQAGTIQALAGGVFMSMKTAAKAIQDVVNADGIVPATNMVEENGYIALVNASQTEASHVALDAVGPCHVTVAGTIAAQRLDGIGGHVEILADRISVESAKIDASGELGGGTVLIGGDYLGSGTSHNAKRTSVIGMSTISVDAIREGDGGKAIVWADKTTQFEGLIYARGGESGGNGGFVETSGKINLFVAPLSNVFTISPKGETGMWLLDPMDIDIGNFDSCMIAGDCSDMMSVCVVSANTIAMASSDVNLCAHIITQSADIIGATAKITMASDGFISLQGIIDSSNSVTMAVIAPATSINVFTNNSSITANGGIRFTPNTNVQIDPGTTLTLNSGSSDILFGGTIDSNMGAGNGTLVINNAGNVAFSGAIGAMKVLTAITIAQANDIAVGSSINTTGSVQMSHAGLLTIATGQTVNCGGNFRLMTPGGGHANLGANFITGNAFLIEPGYSIDLVQDLNITAGSGTSSLIRTNGAHSISFTGPGNFSANQIGFTTPITNLTVNATVPDVSLNSVTATGIISLSNSGIGNLLGGIQGAIFVQTGASFVTFNNLIMQMASNVIFNNQVSIIGGNSVVQTTAGNITFNNTINALSSPTSFLTLIAGGMGTVSLTAAVGFMRELDVFGQNINVQSLTPQQLRLVANNSIQCNEAVTTSLGLFMQGNTINLKKNLTNLTSGIMTFQGNVVLNGDPSITINGTGSGITFANLEGSGIGRIDATTPCSPGPSEALILISNGTINLNSNVGSGSPLETFMMTAPTIMQKGSVVTCHGSNFANELGIFLEGNITSLLPGGDVTVNGTITVVNNVEINTSAGAGTITLIGLVNGAASLGQILTLNAGAGDIIIPASIGQSNPLAGFTIADAGFASLLSPIAAGNVNITADQFFMQSVLFSFGPLTITTNGPLISGLGASFFSIGPMLINGIGLVNIAGQVSAGGGLIMENDLLLSGDLTVTTPVCGDAVTFEGMVNGPHTLTVNAFKLNFLNAVGPEVAVVFNKCTIPEAQIKLASMYIPGLYSSTFNLGSLYYFMPDLITDEMSQMPDPWVGYSQKTIKAMRKKESKQTQQVF